MHATATVWDADEASARIGPNAIIRLQQALHAKVGPERTHALFAQAGQARYLEQPPGQMVAEADVTALYTSLPREFGSPLAEEVAACAGRLTGDYLLAHRIPRPVQALLRCLPAPLALPILVAAIRRNAWTFVGSGRFGSAAASVRREFVSPQACDDSQRHARLLLWVRECPLCRGSVQVRPACTYYAASFETLFAALVHDRAQVVEVACAAMGARACQFEVRW